MATFLQLFEKHQGNNLHKKSRIILIYFKLGLAHFEALELLSNQSSIILQTMSHGNEKVLEQIENYFQINDDDLELNNQLDSLTTNDDSDNNNQIPTLDILSQKFTAHQTQLRSTVSVDKILEVYESANQFIKEWDWMDTELDQKVKYTFVFLCIDLFIILRH